MAKSTKEQDLFDRLNDKVNKDPIHAILAEYQVKFEDIRISGNKDELIEQARIAVNRNQIPKDHFFRLLQDYEENDSQHVLFYAPKTLAVRKLCQNAEGIAEALFGKKWKETEEFPKLPRLESGYEIADFRIGLPNKPKDWVLKVYSFEKTKVKVRTLLPDELADFPTKQQILAANQFAVIFEEKVTESVCVARWNNDENQPLLELKIDSTGRSERFAFDANALWRRLAPALTEDNFVDWKLRKPFEKMIRECDQYNDLYELGHATIIDSGECGVRYTPYTEKEPINANPLRIETMKQFFNDGGRCAGLVIEWLPEPSNKTLPKKLRTYAVANRKDNELMVIAQNSYPIVDYVTDQLRFFAS